MGRAQLRFPPFRPITGLNQYSGLLGPEPALDLFIPGDGPAPLARQADQFDNAPRQHLFQRIHQIVRHLDRLLGGAGKKALFRRLLNRLAVR